MNGPGLSRHPGLVGSGGAGGSGQDGLRQGPSLTDADVTQLPAGGLFSESVLPPATLTANRTLTLGVFDTPPDALEYTVIRRDLGPHTYAVVNGGPGGLTLFTFEASPLTPQGARFSFDGTDWNFAGFFYVQGGTFTVPADLSFLGPAFWVRADLGITNVAGKASDWIDQISGRHHSQPTAGLRPTIVANSVNGRPGLTFGANLFLEGAGGPFTPGQQRWMIAVVKPAANAGGLLFSTRSAGPSWIVDVVDFNGAGTDLALYSDGISHASEANPFFALNGAGHCAEFYSTLGSPIGFVYDGVTKAVQSFLGNTNTVSSDTGGTIVTTIGNYFGHDAGFVGDILEIAAGTGTLTALEQLRARACVAQRYALPFAAVVT